MPEWTIRATDFDLGTAFLRSQGDWNSTRPPCKTESRFLYERTDHLIVRQLLPFLESARTAHVIENKRVIEITGHVDDSKKGYSFYPKNLCPKWTIQATDIELANVVRGFELTRPVITGPAVWTPAPRLRGGRLFAGVTGMGNGEPN